MTSSVHDKEIREIRAILRETSEMQRQSAEKLRQWEKQFGGYTETESKCLEDEFCDALREAGEIGGAKIEMVHRRAQAPVRKGKTLGEYDIVVVNGKMVFVGEIKHKLTAAKVREFHKKLLRYPKHFPSSTRGKEICGMVGGAEIEKTAADAARELGMYVLRLKNRKLAVTAPE